jgi:hypothetical protein
MCPLSIHPSIPLHVDPDSGVSNVENDSHSLPLPASFLIVVLEKKHGDVTDALVLTVEQQLGGDEVNRPSN